jgi:hypothetical protein
VTDIEQLVWAAAFAQTATNEDAQRSAVRARPGDAIGQRDELARDARETADMVLRAYRIAMAQPRDE